jgi:hypothetical protein
MRQNILIFAGLAAILFGALFTLQGLGVIRWPATSSMIDDRIWIWRGLALLVAGAVLVGGVRLVPTRAERKAARDRARLDD